MSEKNGDRSRFQINRKRRVKLRQRVRTLFKDRAPATAAATRPATKTS